MNEPPQPAAGRTGRGRHRLPAVPGKAKKAQRPVGSARRRRGPAEWEMARRLYEEQGLGLAEIARRLELSRSGLRYRIRRDRWQCREAPAQMPCAATGAGAKGEGGDGPVDRSRLVERLYRALDRQMRGIEEHLAGTGEGNPAGEREARTLAALARTLDQLIDLEESAGKTGEAEKVEERDRERFRTELARRLARLGASAGDRGGSLQSDQLADRGSASPLGNLGPARPTPAGR